MISVPLAFPPVHVVPASFEPEMALATLRLERVQRLAFHGIPLHSRDMIDWEMVRIRSQWLLGAYPICCASRTVQFTLAVFTAMQAQELRDLASWRRTVDLLRDCHARSISQEPPRGLEPLTFPLPKGRSASDELWRHHKH